MLVESAILRCESSDDHKSIETEHLDCHLSSAIFLLSSFSWLDKHVRLIDWQVKSSPEMLIATSCFSPGSWEDHKLSQNGRPPGRNLDLPSISNHICHLDSFAWLHKIRHFNWQVESRFGVFNVTTLSLRPWVLGRLYKRGHTTAPPRQHLSDHTIRTAAQPG